MTHTDESIRDLLLSDIAAIRTTNALKTWALRWAKDLKSSPHLDELRKAYLDRQHQLSSNP